MGFGERTPGFKLDTELLFQIFHEVQYNLMKLSFWSVSNTNIGFRRTTVAIS